MSEQKEIKLNKKNIRFIVGAIVIPLLLTFVLEHFGKFKATALGSVNDPSATEVTISNARLNSRTFKTIFGNKIEKNYYSENKKAYRYTSGGTYKTSPTYLNRIPFYLKAVLLDIIYPLVLSIILIGIYFFRKKFKIQFTEE